MDIEVKVPDIGLDELEVTEILVHINEYVALEQGLITVEGDKTSMEIPSPISGIVKKIHIKIGDKVKTDSCIMIFKVDSLTTPLSEIDNNKIDDNHHLEKSVSYNPKYSDFPKNVKKDNIFHATPVIRRLARNLNINLCEVVGTGPKKRILKEDLELYKNTLVTQNNQNHLNIVNESEIKELKLSNMQKTVGYNLHQNWINIPHVTQFDEVNVTLLEEFRKKYNNTRKIQKKIGNNITMLIFVIKVVSYALEKFPIFNSFLTAHNKKIILKKYINIGIAVDIDNELYVPVLKDTNKKNVKQLSNELRLLLEKAKNKQLHATDMTDGCFTISNLGGIGGSWFSPIINAPEVAILGVSKIQTKPLWDGKQFIPSLMLPLSLSYDHRVINGAIAARFLTFIGKILSDIHFLIM
ncbi:dihydrolipoamide acetyltransferase [Buchnera aphidicola (Macrosiphoniella sanborni)]|uniref:Dihydrolipoamide acetyltransferase component of pyruvate dehydrogenase complex n=1 Tax=Buchnera aphidicola (Macrosiphoniella sanborni) TaxID=1241865 RepID=A0A4D6YHD7_9GAMM|nr:2-oxo acid dehydrogenase subunit E2 [Buchnera aphidicola]QCI23755.1 dihydrolipoamide acetyltransferase [Buchnera aphidicola (Macrosiphoniella sanborni)]